MVGTWNCHDEVAARFVCPGHARVSLRCLLSIAMLFAVASPPFRPVRAAVETTGENPAQTATETDDRDTGGTAPSVDKHVRENRRGKIEEAVAQLLPEAEELGKYQDAKVTPHLKRPHPSLGLLASDMANDVLERMLKPFVGNLYEDTFIRWHLMHVAKTASQAEKRNMGPALVKLVKQMPGPLKIPERPEWRWVPHHIGQRWYAIYESLRVVIGYSPYQDRINAPGSFEYMDNGQRQQAESRWKEALALEPQFEQVWDHEAVVFNQRIQEVNWIVRQYRGELIYLMFWTGDPKMARLLMSEISRQARLQNGIALDLVSFWYLAAFEGALDLYDPALLRELSNNLERTARNHDRWFEYKLRQRNLADYSFHLIQMLKEVTGSSKVNEG